MFAEIDESIRDLIKIVNNVYCKRMNRSNIIGYLGELLILKKFMQEVENRNCIVHKGNQSSYDLSILDTYFIDVKTSTLKSEAKGLPDYWGWALKFDRGIVKPTSSKRKEPTHFICVALTENFDVKNYYVIKYSDLSLFPGSGIKQFKNVQHGYIVPEKKFENFENLDIDFVNYVNNCMKLNESKIILKLEPNQSLFSALV